MSIKLYVNAFATPDNTVAVAINPRCISFNLDILANIRNSNSPTIVLAAGKYVVITAEFSDTYAMMFFDFKKNRGVALSTTTNRIPADLREKFMEVFEAVTANYDLNVNKVSLVIGEPPISSKN